MQDRIFARQPNETEPEFFRRVAGRFQTRATARLHAGLNPVPAAELAADFTRLAQRREREQQLLATDAGNTVNAGER